MLRITGDLQHIPSFSRHIHLVSEHIRPLKGHCRPDMLQIRMDMPRNRMDMLRKQGSPRLRHENMLRKPCDSSLYTTDMGLHLETERLHLIPMGREHVPFLHRLWTDPEVRRFLWDDRVILVEEAAEVVEGSLDGPGMWVLQRKGGEEIGFCGFRDLEDQVEILYALLPGYWGQGLATEASREALRYAFEELGLERVYAGADPPNETSFRVMERLGMKFDSRRTLHGLEAVYYVIHAS